MKYVNCFASFLVDAQYRNTQQKLKPHAKFFFQNRPNFHSYQKKFDFSAVRRGISPKSIDGYASKIRHIASVSKSLAEP